MLSTTDMLLLLLAALHAVEVQCAVLLHTYHMQFDIQTDTNRPSASQPAS